MEIPPRVPVLLSTGKGSFVFHDDAGRPEKPVKVWYYKPSNITPNTKIVFVMHGVKRNGEEYRNQWVRHAKNQFLLVVPEFSETIYSREEYQFGNVSDPNVNKWSFSVIEHLFDSIRSRESMVVEKYSIFGHSAGAQFVHRFMLFMPSPRVEVAISANSGSYTMPIYPSGGEPEFPWSLEKNIVCEQQLKSVFTRPLVVMLGEHDTDPNHKHLPRTPQAMAQGINRFKRGQNFFQSAQKQATTLSTPFKWTLVTVPGVAHSDKGMSEAAVNYLFNKNEE